MREGFVIQHGERVGSIAMFFRGLHFNMATFGMGTDEAKFFLDKGDAEEVVRKIGWNDLRVIPHIDR